MKFRSIIGSPTLAALLLTSWSCVSPLRQDPKLDCIIGVIGPIKSQVAGLDVLVEQKWREKITSSLRRDCDRLIPKEQAAALFIVLNQSNEVGLDMAKIGTRQMAIIRERTSANFLVQLTHRRTTEGIVVDSQIWNIQGGIPTLDRKVLKGRVLIPEGSKSLVGLTGAPSFLRRFKHSLPNSLVVGSSNEYITNKRVSDGEFVEVEHNSRGLLPPIIGGINLTNIDHPDGYALFDWSVSFFTGLSLLYFDDSYLLKRTQAPRETVDYSLHLYGIHPHFNGELAAHSPFGTLFAGLGYGLALFSSNDNFENSAYGVSRVTRVFFGYRAFATERIFVQLVTEAQAPIPTYIDTEYFESMQTNRLFIGLGYFWPEARNLVTGSD